MERDSSLSRAYRCFCSPASKFVLHLAATITLLLVAGVIILQSEQPISQYSLDPSLLPTISSDQLKFDVVPSYDNLKLICERFPDRVVGSDNSREMQNWLTAKLNEYGYNDVKVMNFTVTVKSEVKHGANLFIELSMGANNTMEATEVDNEEVFVFSAHYDVAEPATPGASDDASGVSVILELARVMAQYQYSGAIKRTLVLLFTDSEEYGHFFGAWNFVEHYSKRDKIRFVVDLDYLNAGNLTGIGLSVVGLYQGFTPIWIREMAQKVIHQSLNLSTFDMDPFTEYMFRGIPITFADYGVYLNQGIPAINLGGTTNFPFEVYHTHYDKLEYISVDSLHQYGLAVELVLKTLFQLPALDSFPHYGYMDYYKVSTNSLIDGKTMKLIHFLLFAPLLVKCILTLWNTVDHFPTGFFKSCSAVLVTSVVPELISVALWFLTIAVSWLTMLFLVYVVKQIPKYERYPATPNDSYLLHPDAISLVYVGLAVLAAFLVLVVLVDVIVIRTCILSKLKRQLKPYVAPKPTDTADSHQRDILTFTFADDDQNNDNDEVVRDYPRHTSVDKQSALQTLLQSLKSLVIVSYVEGNSRRLNLQLLMSTYCFYIWILNSYTAVVFLLLPAYLWMFITTTPLWMTQQLKPEKEQLTIEQERALLRHKHFEQDTFFRRPDDQDEEGANATATSPVVRAIKGLFWITVFLLHKMVNLSLAVGGSMLFLGFVIFFSTTMPIGPAYWYLMLGSVYGLFPWQTSLAFVFGLTLLVRFLLLGLQSHV